MSQRTEFIFIRMANLLMLLRAVIDIYGRCRSERVNMFFYGV
jgi:hypothetical protein